MRNILISVPGKKEKLPLSVTHPELAEKAFDWDPSKFTQGSDKKQVWNCQEGHQYESSIANQVRRIGCGVCAGTQIIVGVNDLATTHPELSNWLVDADPCSITSGSGKKCLWRCDLGHITEARVYSKARGNGCPICANDVLLTGFNDISTKDPELSKDAHNWDPSKTIIGTNKKLEWKCYKCGYVWFASANQRRTRGCAVCKGQKVVPGLNDLATTHPHLALEAYKWNPQLVFAHTGKKLEWICLEFGHTWKATGNNRASKRKDGCSICSGQQLLQGFNDLETTHPRIAAELVGFDPKLIGPNDKKVREWKCRDFPHTFFSKAANRTRRDGECNICAGKIVLAGFNDLSTVKPLLASEAFGWDPSQVVAFSSSQKKWKCKEGHIWNAKVANRSLGNGCPSCAIYGFNPNQEGYLYFLFQPEWEMLQIGITNVPDDRLKRHRRRRWELLELRGPMDGHLTQQWETAILRMLKEKGADLSNSKIAGKFDGYSEAWSKSTFEVKSIKELMRLTEEFEEI